MTWNSKIYRTECCPARLTKNQRGAAISDSSGNMGKEVVARQRSEVISASVGDLLLFSPKLLLVSPIAFNRLVLFAFLRSMRPFTKCSSTSSVNLFSQDTDMS